MKKYVLAALVVAAALLPAPRAECVWCSTVPCFGAHNCGKCLCLRTDPGPGRCVSLQGWGW